MKQNDRTVRLLVIHEPQPPGLRQVTIKRNVGEALGLNICGGIGSPPANPLDKSDEGIFIEKVRFTYEEIQRCGSNRNENSILLNIKTALKGNPLCKYYVNYMNILFLGRTKWSCSYFIVVGRNSNSGG